MNHHRSQGFVCVYACPFPNGKNKLRKCIIILGLLASSLNFAGESLSPKYTLTQFLYYLHLPLEQIDTSHKIWLVKVYIKLFINLMSGKKE